MRRLRSLALPLIAATVLGTFALDADAAARTSSLAWVRMPGAETCIDARALAQAVELRLGRSAFVAPTGGDVAIEARMERLQGANANVGGAPSEPGSPPRPSAVWRATITVVDSAGALIGLRELQTDQLDCHAIDAELELVIALLIDPSAVLAPPIPPTPPTPPSTFTPPLAPSPFMPFVPPRAAPPAAPICPPPPLPSPWRMGVAAGAVAGLGFVPGPAGVGLALRAHLAPPRGPSFDLGGAVWASPVVESVRGAPAFSLAYGSLSLCPFDVALGANTLSACVGVLLGSLRVDSTALLAKYRQEQLVFDLDVTARFRRRFVGPLFGAASVGLAVPTRRDIYYVIDAAGARRDVFQASPVGALLDLGLGLELP